MATKRSVLGGRIAAVCGMQGVSMAELARAIGITPNSMSRIVRGEIAEPRVKVLRDVAEHLQVSTDYLLGLRDEMNFEAVSVS